MYSYTVETEDVDGDTITTECTACPSWLSVSGSTVSGTPDNDEVGDHSVVLISNRQTTSDTQSFTITVTNVNSMGSVSLSGTTTEDQTLTATVSDPDGLTGVTVTYQWQSTDNIWSNSGSWSDISGATSSTYDLTQSEVGNYVRVFSIIHGCTRWIRISHWNDGYITVANVNDDNTGTPTMSGSFMENQTVTVDATPLDDNDEDGMTTSSYAYQWQRCSSTTLSTCSDISGETSTSYTITQTDTDNFLRVVVSYTDDLGTAETVNTALSSQVGNINDAPDAGSDQTGALTEDASTTTATGTVSASDPDTTDTLSYTPSSTSGTYGSFAVTSDGDWTYTLDNDDSDTTSLDTGDSVTEQYTITVSDGSLSDTMTVTITITGANDAPTITSTAVTGANEDAAYSYTTTASDDDADDTVTLTCTTVPSWLSCTDGALTGTPSNARRKSCCSNHCI